MLTISYRVTLKLRQPYVRTYSDAEDATRYEVGPQSFPWRLTKILPTSYGNCYWQHIDYRLLVT